MKREHLADERERIWWDEFTHEEELRIAIREWELKATPTATDYATQQQHLTDLRAQLDALGQRQAERMRLDNLRVWAMRWSITEEEWEQLIAIPPLMAEGGYYISGTLEAAAIMLAKEQGWHNGARDALLEQMVQAVRDGSLTVRHPHTDLPYHPRTVRIFYEHVTAEDLNAWLESQGVDYRLQTDGSGEAPKDKGAPRPAEPAQGANRGGQNGGRIVSLPEQDYFTYAEIAERWGCSVEHVARYVETGKLEATREWAPGALTGPRSYTLRPVTGERVDNDKVYVCSGDDETLLWVLHITRKERDRFELEHRILIADDKPEDPPQKPAVPAKGAVQAAREDAFRRLLDEMDIPKNERLPHGRLSRDRVGFTYEDIRANLLLKKEFLGRNSGPISEGTYDRYFWNEQQIAKFPNDNE